MFLKYLRHSFVNLMAAKLRSFLAVLGILVGTAAVVALISCGKLATEKALEQFKKLGTDLLAVSAYPKAASRSVMEEQIPLELWRQLPERIPDILQVAPYSATYQNISFAGKVLQGSVIGADESLAKIIDIKLAQGNFVSFVESFEHFCVIGDGLARQIRQLGFNEPLGKQLKLGKSIYTIIGIVQPWQENGFFNEDINRTVIVPIGGIALLSKQTKINNAIFLLKPNGPIDAVIEKLKQIINQKAPNLVIFPRSAKQIIIGMETQGKTFTLLLAIIGGISLLVGGIGVMNIMLVSVSERKKEIGIRKAVGARDSEIQLLFLVESLILSLFGGLCGIIFGIALTAVIAYFSQWPFTIYLTPLFVGFIVSVATGVFFGFYPARRAAKLAPITALRSE